MCRSYIPYKSPLNKTRLKRVIDRYSIRDMILFGVEINPGFV